MFATLVGSLPVELTAAVKQHKLDRPGVLRSYPRSSLREVGLATVIGDVTDSELDKTKSKANSGGDVTDVSLDPDGSHATTAVHSPLGVISASVPESLTCTRLTHLQCVHCGARFRSS